MIWQGVPILTKYRLNDGQSKKSSNLQLIQAYYVPYYFIWINVKSNFTEDQRLKFKLLMFTSPYIFLTQLQNSRRNVAVQIVHSWRSFAIRYSDKDFNFSLSPFIGRVPVSFNVSYVSLYTGTLVNVVDTFLLFWIGCTVVVHLFIFVLCWRSPLS